VDVVYLGSSAILKVSLAVGRILLSLRARSRFLTGSIIPSSSGTSLSIPASSAPHHSMGENRRWYTLAASPADSSAEKTNADPPYVLRWTGRNLSDFPDAHHH